MKIKTAILSGNALRYAVAKARGMVLYALDTLEHEDDQYWVLWPDGSIRHSEEDFNNYSMNRRYFQDWWQPDLDGKQADTIIEEWIINTVWDGSCWIGSVYDATLGNWVHNQTAPKRKLAAMRTFVSLHFGPEVEIPDNIPNN